MTSKRSPRKFGITRKREIDPETVGTQLYRADKRLLDEEVGKRGSNRSAVVRDFFHQVAMKKRLAPDTPDGAEEASLHALQKKTVAELAEARKELQSMLRLLREVKNFQEDSLELNETDFKRVFTLDSAHFNVSAQGFTLLWGILDLLQRFVANPMLARTEEHQANPNAESTRQLLDARTEGLHLLEQFSEQHHARESLEMGLLRFDE
jgi:hypothetical protein